jgi:RNA polymerase sigma factor (sigma-70 family)
LAAAIAGCSPREYNRDCMNLKIQHRNLEVTPVLNKLIARQAGKVRKLLPTFAGEVLDLNVNLERLPRGNQFQTVLVLAIPQRAIRVEEIEDNAASSVLRAFEELLRRVKRFKSQLNRERLWRRPPAPVAEETPASSPLDFERVFGDQLEKVENYLRREIYHQVLMGRIPAGVLEPHALVDEVFLRASARVSSRPNNVSVDQWIIQVAREALRKRMDEVDSHREERHFEEAAGLEDRWYDESLNFYQPDEVLRLSDLLADSSIDSPEAMLEREDVENQMQKILASLPDEVRESFVLFALEGFTSDEVAMITGKDPETVLEKVETARHKLKQELKT